MAKLIPGIVSQQEVVRDSAHASLAFTKGNFAIAPRFEHLFHVVFNFTEEGRNELRKLGSFDDRRDYSILVKSVDLPSFTINVQEYNQYNRRVQAQHRITYETVTVVFHDDAQNKILRLWNAYYQAYFKDPTYDQSDFDRDDRYAPRQRERWGQATPTFRFFEDVKIYTLHQKKFAEYTLINPIINDFRHGRHNYYTNEIREHQMSFSYEGVKYRTGVVNGSLPIGFPDSALYDTLPSPRDFSDGFNFVNINGRIVDVSSQNPVDLSQTTGSQGSAQTQQQNTQANVNNNVFPVGGINLPVLRGATSTSNEVFPVNTSAATPTFVPSATDSNVIGSPTTSNVGQNSVTSNNISISNNKFALPTTDIKNSRNIPVGNSNIFSTGNSGSPATPATISSAVKFNQNQNREQIVDTSRQQAESDGRLAARTVNSTGSFRQSPTLKNLVDNPALSPNDKKNLVLDWHRSYYAALNVPSERNLLWGQQYATNSDLRNELSKIGIVPSEQNISAKTFNQNLPEQTAVDTLTGTVNINGVEVPISDIGTV